MKCPKCSAENPEDALSCFICGHSLYKPGAKPQSKQPESTQKEPEQYRQQPYQQQPHDQQQFPSTYDPNKVRDTSRRSARYSAPIPNYLLQAILATIFCCLPFGIVAIVYSAQVSSNLQIGDYEKAEIASLNAKKWTNIAVITGVAVWIISILISLLGNISKI